MTLTKDEVVGIFPPLFTPFTADGELDRDGFIEDIEYQLQHPVTGLVVGGSTGEGHALSGEELAELTKIAVDHVKGRVPIVTGIITTTTREAVARGRAAREAGARGVMVTPPIYQSPSFDGMVDFYDRIHKQTELPVIIYNVMSHAPMTPAITQKLAEIGAIIATKESVGGSFATLSELLDTVADKISVTWAQDHLLYPGLAMGATGSISGTGAMFPAESIAMLEAIKRNDYDEAKRIHFALAPLTRAVMNGKNWPAWIKAVATEQGRRVGPARLPFVPLNDEELALVKSGLEVAKTALSPAAV
ncbi:MULTISPECIES: dihydrodipicolinate synthase family protein [unclassified Arthrobacter]|uniref:dihydrodipicolinate synthase family protein n=1 Tax=unclassified Arthrobacter TaxID=235627 RepID=UPI001C85C144|nr:dihydrodipicolinate synthase family protein [Arthrobacter sp. MAHUQ-56]MBX7445959.1 dihydrodipicolinate synthase family protein [Arthrobacter sp. MAHUQ-56]